MRLTKNMPAVNRPLRAGVTVRQAQAELDTIAQRLETAYPDTNRGWRVRLVPLNDFIVGDVIICSLAEAGEGDDGDGDGDGDNEEIA